MNNEVALIHTTVDGDKLIAYMARVSNPANQSNPDNSKLINYLIKHQHWSPFEMVNMCVEIWTTRSISTQILRHRSFSFQEFSTRYSSPCTLSYPIEPQLRKQDLTNRQNSTDDLSEEDKERFGFAVRHSLQSAYTLYEEMIQAGIAKECAREVLPLAIPTKLYMNGTLRSWIHYVNLRTHKDTQLEHRDIALKIKKLIELNYPLVYKAAFT